MKKLIMFLVLVPCLVVISAQGATLWGTTYNLTTNQSEIYTFHTETGTIVKRLTTDPGIMLFDIGITPDGKIYAVGQVPGGSLSKDLIWINRPTGGSTQVTINQTYANAFTLNLNGLVGETNNSLLAIRGSLPADTSQLVRITLNGDGSYNSYSVIKTLNGITYAGGDISRFRDEYVYTNNNRADLWSLSGDLSTTAFMSNLDFPGFVGLAFDPEAGEGGILYGVNVNNNMMYAINPFTGSTTMVPGFDGLVWNSSGLAYDPLGEDVPEPATIALLALGISMMVKIKKLA